MNLTKKLVLGMLFITLSAGCNKTAEPEAQPDSIAETQSTTAPAVVPESKPYTFIPEDFKPPILVETPDFKVVPLGPDLVDIDYVAYMSSIEHLQKTFTRSTSWPHADLDAQDAMQDMLNEQQRFTNRESFAYAVLTLDGTTERGCVYVYPSSVPGYDAEVRLWVTQSEFDEGFDAHLYAWTQTWIKQSWPFQSVAYPGRAIEWETWDKLKAESEADPA